MELKSYQNKVLNDLTRYLELINEYNDYIKAYNELWNEKGVIVDNVNMQKYRNIIDNTPSVCFKVPTGGGKTFIACNSIKPIFNGLGKTNNRLVVWLVPSDTILKQTLKNLQDPTHPYRKKLNIDFNNRVEVLSKSQALNGQHLNPSTIRDNLTILVLSYDSFRITNKDGRKVYQENGYLMQFEKSIISNILDVPKTALIHILNNFEPLIIVDESHHAKSDLSIDMLKNLNASFILELTATPKDNSNIISYVDAIALKNENMVKLPVILYNRKSVNDVLQDTIALRQRLEELSQEEYKETGKYIRPIALLQAQPKNKDDSITFTHLKDKLITMGIPQDQIAIKIANKDEFKNIDLMSKDCPIRYIITVNALKEGWDCPFAYILSTITNKNSSTDVEQLVGRILRQPYTQNHKHEVLNSSYVFTSSNNFRDTVENVIKGLNNAGFSKKDMRSHNQDDYSTIEIPKPLIDNLVENIPIPVDNNLTNVEIPQDTLITSPNPDLFNNTELSQSINDILKIANEQTQDYQQQTQNYISENSYSMEEKSKMNIFTINDEFKEEISTLKIPMFVYKNNDNLFDDISLVDKNYLLHNFQLANQDTNIDFNNLNDNLVKIDIDNKSMPKSVKLNSKDSLAFKEYFESLSSKDKTEICKHKIFNELSSNTSSIPYSTDIDLYNYINRIVSSFTLQQLEDLQISPSKYIQPIKNKIETLANRHKMNEFTNLLNKRIIFCTPYYEFPKEINPQKAITLLPKSLYTAECDDLNNFEYNVIQQVSSLDNIRWWHRVSERNKQAFHINGFINHYPDFLVMTNRNILILLETKGDHLGNENSLNKIKLGNYWQQKAGNSFEYFMVFENTKIDGAYTLNEFMDIISNL